jgi:hypothetical protein
MNIKKILSSALVVLMVFTMFAGFIPVRVDAAYSAGSVGAQSKTVDEINALWYDEANTWGALRNERSKIDELINEFNEATGLLKNL